MRLAPLLSLLLLTGCKELKKVDAPELPRLELDRLPLPKGLDGRTVLAGAAQARLVLDPTAQDALTAVGACTDWVTHCYAPPERSLDACVESAPTCATARPWEEAEPCCPRECLDRYTKVREGGRPEVDAFEQAFFLEGDCFPGLKAALEGR